MTATKRPAAPRPFIDWGDKWARIWAGVLAFALSLIALGVLIHIELANRWLNWPGVFGYPV